MVIFDNPCSFRGVEIEWATKSRREGRWSWYLRADSEAVKPFSMGHTGSVTTLETFVEGGLKKSRLFGLFSELCDTN